MDNSNFKSEAINEAISIEATEHCCRIAFLSGLFKTIGTIEITRKGANALFTSDNILLIENIEKAVKNLYLTDPEIEQSKYTNGSKKGQLRYELRILKGQTKQLLSDTGAMEIEGETFKEFTSGIPQKVVGYSCCAKSFIRSMFIGCGSVYVPNENDEKKSEGYHLEFQLNDEKTASDLIKLLSSMGIQAKTSVRGTVNLVYLKDKQVIFSFFQTLSMAESALRLDSIIKERELNGSINRNSICEAANLDKSYAASAAHLLAIQNIDKKTGLNSLSKSLREAAYARINNPRLSLNELADILGVTKSCLNHRMRKLMQLAELDGDNNE